MKSVGQSDWFLVYCNVATVGYWQQTGNISNLESRFQVQDGGEARERMQWEISYSKLDLLLQIENGLLSISPIKRLKTKQTYILVKAERADVVGEFPLF